MEIAPVPHRSGRGEWRRLTLGLLVLVPVVLLVLLPAVLGLDRYVVTDTAAPGTGRGSVVLARETPRGDLRSGDVVTVSTARGSQDPSDERLTRRITSIDGDLAQLNGGLQVRLEQDTYARVWLTIPWIGYPFVVDGGWVLLVMIAVAALPLALRGGRRRRRRTRRSMPSGLPRPTLPVG
ncbi:hypothetical protein [Nocardioides flavescens]|uniref:Signal peptidase I n=1 Tax=Nocardioides flavescens TaxID=2691959 RepID=A0A6L7EY80_9ACTN|nr:hypothetical protein [Nocardioides flavescens]MXG90548.1 hypothetical protein [Nocardioides flavescens]